MKTVKTYILFVIVFLLTGMSSWAQKQKVSNVAVQQNGRTVVVNYDIDLYSTEVDLYISMSGGRNFYGPLKHVSGDIENVKAGKRSIIWDAATEFGSLHGDNIVFEVRPKKLTSKDWKNIDVLGNPVLTSLHRKGKSMKTWGIVLTSVGCVFFVTALYVFPIDYQVGFPYAGLSLACLGSGIPLWVVGNNKMKQARSLAYAPVFEYPVEYKNLALVPSVGITNDNITHRQYMSAGLAFRF